LLQHGEWNFVFQKLAELFMIDLLIMLVGEEEQGHSKGNPSLPFRIWATALPVCHSVKMEQTIH
jgi:hypothetical protein